jgi:hypothetical protein
MRWIVGSALALLAVVMAVPLLRDLFQIAVPHPVDVWAIALGGVASAIWMGLTKRLVS